MNELMSLNEDVENNSDSVNFKDCRPGHHTSTVNQSIMSHST